MSKLLSASLRKSMADVTCRKGRTLMVVLGIFIGVLGLTGVNFIQQTIFSAFRYSVGSAANYPDIVLRVNSLDSALTPTLAAVPNVQAVQMESSFDTQWHVSAAPGHVPISIIGYPDLQHIPITPFQLTSGRYPGVGEVLLEYGDQDLQAVSIGDTVTVDTSTNTTATLRVVGFVRTQGLQSPVGSGIARAYMNETAITQAFGALVPAPHSKDPQLQYAIAFKVHNANQANATADALTQKLQADHVTVLAASVSQPFNQQVLKAVDGVFTLLLVLSILAVILSGLLILNTVTTLIVEQTSIIGTMKAVGGTRLAILRGYLISVVIYSALGTLPALALSLWLGYPLAVSLASTIPLDVGPFTIVPWVIVLGLAVGFGVPLLAALVPLLIGTRITVREALSAYGVSAGKGNSLVSNLAQRLTRVSQTTWLGLRGVFRKRWRAALTLLTLTLAGITFLVVQTASAATYQNIQNVYANYSYDVSVRTDPNNIASAMTQISALPGVQRVEREREDYQEATRWGPLHLVGLQQDTQLYHPQIISGRWLSPTDSNAALINEDAAIATGLKVGDTFGISSGSIQKFWTVIGIVHQPMSDLGQIGIAITSLETLNALDGNAPDFAVDVLVQARNHSTSAVNQLTRQIDQLLNQGDNGGGIAETIQSIIQRRQQGWYIFYALLYGVALIVGAAGVLGLANALAASVLERRREIGLLRSMGGSAWRVARVFWVEGLTLGGISWCLGALLGLPLAYAFVQLMDRLVLRVDFAVAPSAFGVMLLAVLVISTLASIVPALRASRVRIADMLRYE